PDPLMGAAETDLAAGHPAEARQWLAGLRPEDLNAFQRMRAQLLQAEILLAEERPVEALQSLPLTVELRPVPELAPRAEADRAQVLFRLGDVVGATRTLVAREKLLADP